MTGREAIKLSTTSRWMKALEKKMLVSTRPLDGIRVLALENFVAGPFCSMWLADAGAEVIKIEAPGGGDLARMTGPAKQDPDGETRGLGFVRSNRNKKSVTLDLKHPEGQAMFKELTRHTDIIVENLRPGVMDRLGVGYETLRELNPRLIYVAISGFGQKGALQSPYMDRPAFDIVGQALSGLMYRPEREHERPVYLGFSLADLQGGMLGAYAATLALIQRGKTGLGQLADISLYDASLTLNEISVAMFSATRKTAKPGIHAVTAPFGTYKAKDGYIVIAVLGEHIWGRFCDVIGQPQLRDDPRFAQGPLRLANKNELDASIAPWLAERTREQAVDELLAGGVPASVVQDVIDVFDCPHVEARNMLMTIDDPAWGPIRVVGNPVKLSGAPEPASGIPPRLGEHTEEILRELLGTTHDDIVRLKRANVI